MVGATLRARIDRIAVACADGAGSPWAFVAASVSVLVWLAVGIALGFSDMVLLIGNTVMSLVSYLLLFILQSSGQRDTAELKTMIRALVRDLPDVNEGQVLAEVAEAGADPA